MVGGRPEGLRSLLGGASDPASGQNWKNSA